MIQAPRKSNIRGLDTAVVVFLTCFLWVDPGVGECATDNELPFEVCKSKLQPCEQVFI